MGQERMDVELDPSTRRLRPTIVFGGTPARFVRLSSAGTSAMDEIESGQVRSEAAQRLADRLIDAGMAHRCPVAADPDATRAVSIVIPVYARADEVCDLVARLQSSAPSVHEIIIVDDASPPGAARRLSWLADTTAGVRLIRHETNLGPAAARNTGVGAVDSSRVLFIDSDCVVPESPGWLETLLGHIGVGRPGPRIAAVAPRIVPRIDAGIDPRIESAGIEPAGIDARQWDDHAAAPIAQQFERAFCPLDMGPNPGLVGPDRRVRYVPTAALLVDLEAVDAIGTFDSPQPRRSGLFDADLRFGEDVDLVWRLVEGGGRVVYEPSVEIGHRGPGTIGDVLRRRFNYGTSAAELDRRHRGAVNHLTVSSWAGLTAGATVAGSAPMVMAAAGAQVATLQHRLDRASLPTDHLGRAVVTSLFQSVLGVGRYLNQFWWPVVVAMAVNRRVPAGWRVRLVMLCLSRSFDEVVRSDGSVPQRAVMIAVRTADEAAYGAGVWKGALAQRCFRVVAPRFGHWKPKADPDLPSGR